MAIPPPDVPHEVPSFVSAEKVFIQTVGYINAEEDVEVLASAGGGTEFFRFYVTKTSRVLREFWKHIGVINVIKLQDGAYQDTRGGCGPYSLSGMALGEDLPLEAPPEEELPENLDDAEAVVVAPINIAREHSAGEAPAQRTYTTKVLVGVRLERRK